MINTRGGNEHAIYALNALLIILHYLYNINFVFLSLTVDFQYCLIR